MAGIKKNINCDSGYKSWMNKNTLHVKDVEFSLNLRVILTMLVVTGLCVTLSGVLASVVAASTSAVFCSWVIGMTLAVLFNYWMLSSHRIIKDIKLEISNEEEGEKIYTVMKVE
ncbi:MAG TPA: hypothetical protein ENI45_03895 [Thermoplasmatales archaeon]|nr:hypothetical protein [Thermoplasmatales archaeon]